MPELSREEKKTIIKEAITEWLDAKYSEFGKWTVRGVLLSGFSALAYFLISHGWLK